MIWSCFLLAFRILLALGSISSLLTSSSADESDRLALQAFKAQISDDPYGALTNWTNSIDYCEWNGVTCSRDRRVTVLDLEYKKFEGTLSPHIGNLSFLTTLKLTMNNFRGPIPQEIGRLSSLEMLYLNNNSFVGGIPTNLTRCLNLRELNLIDNKLTGGIPDEISSLTKLVGLGLGQNQLKGTIPSSLGNLSALVILSLRHAHLIGNIPDNLCRLQSIKYFYLISNELIGKVPSCIYNSTNMEVLGLRDNQLEGSLPPDIGFTLPRIREMCLGENKFSGIIPLSFSNASKLEIIYLGANQFTGTIPNDLGRLEVLHGVFLGDNQLGSTSGDDLSFLTSLTNCSNFKSLDVSNNSLRGLFPNSISNLSTTTTILSFGENQIYGGVPLGIENLVNLDMLLLERNHLTGEIPKTIGNFSQMSRLYLHGNDFTGQIPDSFGKLTLLTVLNLSGNKLHGKIPPSLGSCQILLELYLNDNKLSGSIPKQLLHASSLIFNVNLSHNALSGPLPYEVGNLSHLVNFDVSSNRFSGHIPETFGKCLEMEYLSVKDNLFEGQIPQLFNTLMGIEYLDLSHNKLSGQIPEYLSNFTDLVHLDLSYNELEGRIPQEGIFANISVISLGGNNKLCGGVSGLKFLPCHVQNFKKGKPLPLKRVITALIISLSLLLLSIFFFTCYKRRMSKKKCSPALLINDQYTRISYAELHKATSSFSPDNLLGTGSYGTVYKGFLQANTIVAVKVLNLQQKGASKSFLSECNALRNVRHRNLLKIITSCSSTDDFQGNDFKALVFEYMPKGSLEEWLYPRREEHHELRNLNFMQRLKIAIDIASAIEYLHCHSQPPIVHCDIKPSNVLLDDDMIAHVSDFGLAKIFSVTSSKFSQSYGGSLAIQGSIGYVAPEYGMGGAVSLKGDVYSYGILLLEIFIGKRPTDEMFHNGQSLHCFAKAALPEQVMNIVDPRILSRDADEAINIANQTERATRMQECLTSVIRLGVACSVESPIERRNMGEVITELYHIRELVKVFGSI